MWRDQVNYFTRQIIKCFLSLFFSLGRGKKGNGGEDLYRIQEWYSWKTIFLKLILCQNVFCKRSTNAMYLKQKLIRTYFHMWLCILPLRGQTWFLFFYIGHQPNSVTTVLLHYEVVSSFWRNRCIVGVAFLFVFLFSFSLMWSLTAPCCLKIISSYIKDCILRSCKPWLHNRCAIACFIFKS